MAGNTDTFRPTGWDDYIGQEGLKKRLGVRIEAAITEQRPLDHLLLCATPGAGKTSVAHVIAAQLGEPMEALIMPQTQATLASVIKEHSGILLLDEFHRASTKQQEELLPLLEFGWLQCGRRRVEAEWLTVIAATTERGKVIAPIQDRLQVVPWEDYSDDDMARIVLSMAQKGGHLLDVDTAMALGKAAAGTPRLARQMVLAYRDLAATLEDVKPSVEQVLELCWTTEDGLTHDHLRYLETLNMMGGTAGQDVLAKFLRLNVSFVGELERLLVERGLLEYGTKGRELTRAGIARARGKQNVQHGGRVRENTHV